MSAKTISGLVWPLIFAALGLTSICLGATERHPASGMLLSVDPAHHTVTVSCRAIPGYMESMVMQFPVHHFAAKELATVKAGSTVDFTLVVGGKSSYIEDMRVRAFQSLELDPTQAQRLKIIENVMRASPAATVNIGQKVPDFVLTDQVGQRIALSQFSGKIVAVTFVYSRCPLPNYCFRLSSNFAQLQKRFRSRLGRDLILLSVIIDPVHETQQTLRDYAGIWKADPQQWHFLTGPLPDIEEICRHFNMNFYPDEALLVHSFSTAIIARDGSMAALLEGNDFTSRQLGDLVQTMLSRPQ